ncbi:hypothetical protein KSF_045080 [Reticulibacter mediterranei]|uniref:DUF4012 domain-containing protein n=1 Tax=Reticulibacter mediterranei TaxID=2778369 RepID=A0A8J3IL55_9CHLR|nr:hypothetical protein KSF_045080 [Reticulibacter mediterranei]
MSGLNSRNRRRYRKRRAAVISYFTTAVPVDKLAAYHHIPVSQLLQFIQHCLMMHEDGSVWGFRALIPGMRVIDGATSERDEAVEDPIRAIESELLEDAGTTFPEQQEIDDYNSIEVAIDTVDEQQGDIYTPIPEIPDELDEINTPLIVIDEPVEVDAERTLYDGTDALQLDKEQPIEFRESIVEAGTNKHRGRQRRFFTSRRMIHMRRQRAARQQQHRNQRIRLLNIVSGVILMMMLLGTLLPLGLGLMAYNVYNDVNGIARSGMNHLLAVKTLLPSSTSDPLAALDSTKLRQAQKEFQAAESDFVQLEQLVNRSDLQMLVDQVGPSYSSKLLMARHLVRVALDVSRMGQELSGVGITASGILHSSPLASDTKNVKPLISVTDVSAAQGALIHALSYIDDISTEMRQVDLRELPISAKQKTQLTDMLALLPRVRGSLLEAQGLVGTVAWLLGVGQTRRFLVQTMDRAELRPGGGFTGQYGILQLQDGRMAPFSLRDVALLDYAGNGMELGRAAPPEYSQWMNFGNWGLRDSNLSGDYPTTARMSMSVFEEEGGGPVDGDISFTPTFISHILDVTGPIYVADYKETITSQNLEERLHYYQQDYNAIAVQQQKTNDTSHSVRKTFTTLVGKLLLDRVRHLPTSKLVAILKNAVKDIQSRDLEIYFANPVAEQWLIDHGYSGGMDSFQKNDGFMVVQANISISKASQYVHTTEQDHIVLDAGGGATHNLTITLNYQQTGPVYGFDTYADYMRIYTAQAAQLLGGHGFDSGQCYNNGNKGCCAASAAKPSSKGDKTPATNDTGCGQYKHAFPDDARYCPDGNYDLGMRGSINKPWPIDKLSGPTALASDLPGRSMWGGLTVTPKNCISTITLSWYVPHAVRFVGKHATYSLLVQKQGGYVPLAQVIIDASAIKGMKPLSFQGNLVTDKLLTLTAQ